MARYRRKHPLDWKDAAFSRGNYYCDAPGCRRANVLDPGGGWELPFCLEHLRQLPRKLVAELSSVAERTIFDDRARDLAAQLIAKCRARLRKAGAK